MKFDIVTIFPAMVERPLADGHRGPGDRARDAGRRGARPAGLHDRPASRRGRRAVRRRTRDGAEAGADFSGARCDRGASAGTPDAVVLTSPQGRALHAGRGERLSRLAQWCCCAADTKASTSGCGGGSTEEMSIGDYVLSGGELPALVMIDAVARLVPGRGRRRAVGGEDSFSRGLLDFPQYTRPAGRVAGHERCRTVLLSGNHAEIARWRKREALATDAGAAAGSAGRGGARRRRS